MQFDDENLSKNKNPLHPPIENAQENLPPAPRYDGFQERRSVSLHKSSDDPVLPMAIPEHHNAETALVALLRQFCFMAVKHVADFSGPNEFGMSAHLIDRKNGQTLADILVDIIR